LVITDKTSKLDILAQMYTDKAFFGRMMFPRVFKHSTPQFHNDIYQQMSGDYKLNAMVCFRGSAKSTIALFVHPMHLIAFCPKDDLEFIPLVSESQAQSINHLTQIKYEIEHNRRFKECFGELKGDRWGATDVTTSNGVRVTAMGMRQKMRGIRHLHLRPSHIMLDDLESELNTKTPEMRNENWKWLQNAVIPALDPDRGRLSLIGTIVHHDCILFRVRDNEHWNVVEYAIVDQDGRPVWPDRFPLSWIEQTRAEYESQGRLASFYQEYMNIPTPPEDKGFNEDDIRWHDREFKVLEHRVKALIDDTGKSRVINTFLGIDLAVGVELDHDRNALVVIGVDSEFNIYLLHIETKRTSDPDEIVERALHLAEYYDIDGCGIETVQYQQALATLLMKRKVSRGLMFNISDFKPRNRKDVRLYALQPDFKAHKVFLKKNHEDMLMELLHFPRGRHEDILDAYYYARSVAYMPTIDSTEEMIKYKDQYMHDWEDGHVLSWRVL
jgi:predicted phage terminase large subunit-like protein